MPKLAQFSQALPDSPLEQARGIPLFGRSI